MKSLMVSKVATWKLSVLPGDFEGSKQPYASQYWQPQGRHDVLVGQNKLQDTTDHNKAVKPVEQRGKVTLKIQTILVKIKKIKEKIYFYLESKTINF
jgi:hypothetical protein